ncbi:hypothetical protein [Methylobacterium planeticum]|uniref:Uncharacterized protein n=1 Tax=Methylobacterium planeticum TaxID=2615211 RepID=A0A6N6MK37_9HYPH|nr:hypothetical protein [Methylobacterium planeticum]KAB1068552.1 hypothetical protein F6X51_26690 [Methylobacterium planeticum]
MGVLRLALEDLHHADVLKRLVAGAAQGDVSAFTGAAAQITWAGGWTDALRALVSLGIVPGAIRDAFQAAWHCSASEEFGMKRTLTVDLLGQDRLLVDGLNVLLPPVRPDPMPRTLFQVRSLQDCRAGIVGAWWTPHRDYATALWLTTSEIREHTGERVLLVTEAPATAVVYGTNNGIEVLLDPHRLKTVRVVGQYAPDRDDENTAA